MLLALSALILGVPHFQESTTPSLAPKANEVPAQQQQQQQVQQQQQQQQAQQQQQQQAQQQQGMLQPPPRLQERPVYLNLSGAGFTGGVGDLTAAASAAERAATHQEEFVARSQAALLQT